MNISKIIKQFSVEDILLWPIFLFPILFLNLERAVNVILFLFLFLAILKLRKQNNKNEEFKNPKITQAIIFFSLSSFFLAALITQFIRWNLYLPAFDGPSKLLVAGLIFMLIGNFRIQTIRILRFALPIGLILTLLVILINPIPTQHMWGGRYATTFVDVNTMGSQTSILCFICFSILTLNHGLSFLNRVLLFVGCISGLFISMHSGSRGGWLSFAILFPLWFFFKTYNLSKGRATMRSGLFTLCLLILLLVVGNYFFGHAAHYMIERIQSGIQEVTTWFNTPNKDTSAGLRLSMWKLSLELIPYSPWFGFGENPQIYNDVFLNHPILDNNSKEAIYILLHAGPHSDLFSKFLSMGLIGFMGYISTLCVPVYYFLKKLNDEEEEVRIACQIGILYIAGIFICGLTNEQLSLKYLCSFYGLMVISLLLQIQPLKKSQQNAMN